MTRERGNRQAFEAEEARALRLFRAAIIVFLCLAAVGFASAQADVDTRTLFEQRFSSWDNWCTVQGNHLLTIGPEFKGLVDLGPPATGLLVEKMKKADAHQAGALAEALLRITKKRYPPTILKPDDAAKRVALLSQWWQEGRKGTKAAFTTAVAHWKTAKAKSKLLEVDAMTISYDDVNKTIVRKPTQEMTDLQRAYDELDNMGIEILPCLIEQFQAGEYDLLPLFSELSRVGATGKTVEERAQSLRKWWEAHKEMWVLPEK